MESVGGQTRMSEGSISKILIAFAIPLFLGNLFQQLYNTVDSIILGNLVGNDALAAVTSTTSLTFLVVGFFEGLFLGAGVVVSKYFGAKDKVMMEKAVHTTFCFALIASVVMTLVGYFGTPLILDLMHTPEDIYADASSYVKIYFAGSLGLIVFNACSGIMQAVGDSKHPLIFLAFSSVMNIVLDIVFIVVFDGGVASAALATIISQFLSAVLAVGRLMLVKADNRISFKKLKIDGEIFRQILRYGLPAGVQDSIISFANIVVQSNINGFGKMAVAGCGASFKIEGFAFLPVTSFTAALTTFVGQNLGAKEYERAKRGSRFGVIVAIVIAETIGLILFIFAPFFIGLFTSEAQSITYGVQRARVCSLFYCLLSATHCLSGVLRGAGKAKVPMYTMFTVWCVIRVSILWIFVPIFNNILVVNWVYPITWGISTAFLTCYYFLTDWIHGLEKKKATNTALDNV